MKPWRAAAVGGALLAVAVTVAVWMARPQRPPPNVLLVVWDTVRADHTSIHGHERDTTPFLKHFAEQARVYEHAIASSEWTGPTHASMFTGLPLRTHGMDTYYKWLDGHHVTLAEHLGEAGYDTWAFTGNRFVSDFVNMLQGFEVQNHTFKGRYKKPSAKATRHKLIPEDASTEISPSWTPHGHGDGWSKKLTLHKDAAPVAHRAFARWLDERPDPEVPFFAFFNLMEAHQPRVPSLASRRALMDEATLELALETDSSLFSLMSYVSGKHPFSDAELRAMAATYDAAILDLDRALEALIADLDARGLLDETIVVVTADHGELLGEHGLYSHRWALYEPLVHVPLVVHYPKGLSAGRHAAPVSMNGLFATICELTRVGAPRGVGSSLVAPPSVPVFSELRDPNRVMDVVTRAFPDVPSDQFLRRLSAVVEGELKYIHAGDGEHELYDLHVDPRESDNRFAAEPEHAARLAGLLRTWKEQTRSYDPGARGPEDGARDMDDPEVRRMLEILGYTADEAAP